MYLESGADDDGISAANRFDEMVYEAMQCLPEGVSAGPCASIRN
jgi:hypothetical protein